MGVRIMAGDGEGDSQGACLYCSTSMWAFGPIFEDRDEAEAFLQWYAGPDLRTLTDRELEYKYSQFREWKEKRDAREQARDRFLRSHDWNGWDVRDILTTAFEDDERNEGDVVLAQEGFEALFRNDFTPIDVAEAWALYQRFHHGQVDSKTD